MFLLKANNRRARARANARAPAPGARTPEQLFMLQFTLSMLYCVPFWSPPGSAIAGVGADAFVPRAPVDGPIWRMVQWLRASAACSYWISAVADPLPPSAAEPVQELHGSAAIACLQPLIQAEPVQELHVAAVVADPLPLIQAELVDEPHVTAVVIDHTQPVADIAHDLVLVADVHRVATTNGLVWPHACSELPSCAKCRKADRIAPAFADFVVRVGLPVRLARVMALFSTLRDIVPDDSVVDRDFVEGVMRALNGKAAALRVILDIIRRWEDAQL